MSERRQRASYTVVQPPVQGRNSNGGAGAGQARRGSFGSMRISCHGQEVQEVGAPEENATLVDLFLSGRTSQRETGPVYTSENLDTLQVDLLVDPPCIAPFEDEDEAKPPKRESAMGTSPQDYWKAFAAFKEDDPKLAKPRSSARAFVKLWAEKNNMTEALQNQSGNRSFAELFKKQRSKSRTTTASFRSGVIDLSEGFVNISSMPIGIRKISSASEEQKTGEVVSPGEAICIERVLEKDDVRFLKLADGRGWVFDRRGDLTIMSKMEDIEIGDVWYRVSCKELVDVRQAPVYDEEAKTGRLLCPKELAVVNIKCRVRGQNFVHLADGRGWVFLNKLGARKKERSLGDTVMEECDAEVVHGETWMAQEDILPITNHIVEVGLWTYSVAIDNLVALGTNLHGNVVNTGDVIKVDKRCYANGTAPEPHEKAIKWLRILDGRGWVPEKTPDGKVAVTEKKAGGISYPSTLKDKYADEGGKIPEWAIGLV